MITVNVFVILESKKFCTPWENSMVGLNSLRRETQDDLGGEIVVSEHWKIGVSVVARNTIVFTRDLSLILHSCSI